MPTAVLALDFPALSGARQRIAETWLRNENEAVRELLVEAEHAELDRTAVRELTIDLVSRLRKNQRKSTPIAAFMRQYDLSSAEGRLLMCIAEALLRIPDPATAGQLIRDKLTAADWQRHLGSSDSILVNASTRGLILASGLLRMADDSHRGMRAALRRLTGRTGAPWVRSAVRRAMRLMGRQFVMGQTISAALARSRRGEHAAYRYSFDMLGESALTAEDAARYQQSYRDAIRALGAAGSYPDVLAAPSISVKLSALHPRYEVAQHQRARRELSAQLLELAILAMHNGISLTVDAEEGDRLELSLDILEEVFAHPSLEGWNGLGIVIQAYAKRTPAVIEWLKQTATAHGRRWQVRLVKGAYWDAEIKHAQELGLDGYPVYTRKANTDLAYQVCARRLLAAGSERIYPQFATHNAQTIAAIYQLAQGRPFEFQRLHGMGAELYAEVMPKHRLAVPCRVYAPIGAHRELLPYLVRRLLENGANTSFVNRLADPELPIEALIADPYDEVRELESFAHPKIPLPAELYPSIRKNSQGVNFSHTQELKQLATEVNAHSGPWSAEPLTVGAETSEPAIEVSSPVNRTAVIGSYRPADAACITAALDSAHAAQQRWDRTSAEQRATILETAAEQLEQQRAQFIALCVREAGKTLPDAIAEIREAVDFLRYYAGQCRRLFAAPQSLPGPTGEHNQLGLHGRGVFVCISPWNFPLAIFLGQISAALAAGNTVIAKPAEQTCLIGYAAVRLLHQAGIPASVLHYLPGSGAAVGGALCQDPRVAGVAFTGSTATAWAINQTLAARRAPIAALIAETGGQNALIADSSALLEQVVRDVVTSAFQSAGQRCSAARILLVQEDTAEPLIEMLSGAMAELRVGDPALLATDVGPVIDEAAKRRLIEHAARMDHEAIRIATTPLDPELAERGTFFAPIAYEIQALNQLQGEVFGPILHVLRWRREELPAMIEAINAAGYGLTLGIHSRIDSTIDYIIRHARVGNCYVNRNQIGAVVGVQPFGGEGLSGTGPKAGGPHYLLRFASERTLTVNTTANGGNTALLSLDA